MDPKIYQIYFDANSKKNLDPLFISYDNSNSNDSWFEFSVIKKILESNVFDENQYIGFFSHRFYEKTGLHGKDVLDKIKNSSSDVISFSHSIKDISLYPNSFFQGERCHKGFLNISQNILDEIKLNINLKSLVQDSSRIIFSNHFVAKFSFWKKWLTVSNKIYNLAENKDSKSYSDLNTFTTYKKIENKYQFKVFLIERLVSVVLEVNQIDAFIGLDFKNYPLKKTETMFLGEYLILDSLKTKFLKNGKEDYLNFYYKILDNYWKKILVKN